MTEDKNKTDQARFEEDFDLDLSDLTEKSLSSQTDWAATNAASGSAPDGLGAGNLAGLAEALNNQSDRPERASALAAEEKPMVIPYAKALMLEKILKNIRQSIDQSLSILAVNQDNYVKPAGIYLPDIGNGRADSFSENLSEPREKIVEGLFDGEKMIGPDGKQYTVPANYASKSKLVEGDLMKLTISRGGSFLYKQIGPIDRVRISAQLEKDANGNYYAVSENGRWRVLAASITYYRGEPDDEVIILIPKEGQSRWAAVENVVKEA